MRHSVIAVVALAVLSTAGLARAAAPATYVDNVNGFRLDPPAGWQVKPYTDGGELKLELISADQTSECNVTIVIPDNLQGVTQAMLDAAFDRGEIDGVVKSEIAKTGMTESDFFQQRINRDGHPAIYAKFALEKDSSKIRARKLFIATPARIYNFNCAIGRPEEGEHAGEFDALFASIHVIYP